MEVSAAMQAELLRRLGAPQAASASAHDTMSVIGDHALLFASAAEGSDLAAARQAWLGNLDTLTASRMVRLMECTLCAARQTAVVELKIMWLSR